MPASDLKKVLSSTEELEITVTGRKSARKISLPVWFVLEGANLLLLPVGGSGSSWYRNLLANPMIGISAGGQSMELRAKPTSDLHRVKEVVEKFRAKYGARDVKKYYSRFDACVEVALP